MIHLSHYVSRGTKSTRWDEENAAALCYSCHLRFTKNPHEHTEFFVKRLGQKKYDALILRSHLSFKALRMDEDMIKIYYQTKIKELNSHIIGLRK